VATFVICIFVWLMLHDIAYLIFGVAFGVANLFSGYLYPSIVIENVNTLLARFARKKT
jgi:hypothetical protein